jgi:HSP20 family protein
MIKKSIEFLQIQEEINKIFDEILKHLKISSSREYNFSPNLDIFETKEKIFIIMEAPGLKEDEININLSGRWLIIEGEKKHHPIEGRPKFLLIERNFGKFYKAIPIPSPINSHTAQAILEKGLLKIIFEKVQEKRKKSIQIKVVKNE